MIQDHLQGQMSWPKSFKVAEAILNFFKSQQLLDLKSPGADYLI